MPWWGWIVGWAALMVFFLWGLHLGKRISVPHGDE